MLFQEHFLRELSSVPARFIQTEAQYCWQPFVAVVAIDFAAMIMTAIMIYHIKSKYTAVGKEYTQRQCGYWAILGRKEMVMFFYLYFAAVVMEFLLISNIVPFTSVVYSVLFDRWLHIT